MRPDCRKRVGAILGRPMMAEEERAIDRRMRRAVKQLKRTEPGWKDMTKMQRLDKAAALAGDSFETELAEFRMEAPPKAAPLPQDVRQAEADRQKRMEDLGFTIQAVRGVRFVRRQGNPEDGELTGGRWFTDRPDTANTYSGKPGGDMATASMKVRIRLRNPLVVDAAGKRFDQIPRASLPEAVQKEAIRGKMLSTDDIADAARIAEGGYDGVIFRNLKDDLTSNAITTKPATVYAVFDRKNIRSEFAQFDPAKSEDAGLLFQSKAPENNLFVAHNTSEEKLRKTLELGGMPMPSLAVARTDKGGFTGYGEITFLADPRILNEKDVTAYDADIYSPRVPQALPEYDEAEAAKFIKEAKPSIPEDAGILPYLSLDEMTSDLPYELSHSDFVRAAYLAEQGRLPKLKKLKVPPAVRKAMDLEWMSDDWKALAIEHFQKMEDEFNAARVEAGREPINLHFEDDGTLSRRSLNEFDNLIRKARKSQYDQEAFQREVYSRTVGTQAAREKFQKYTTALATRITKGKRMFAGFSYSGNRRFKAFNLENIMQEMRKEMREGQRDAFGGEGSIRARVATAPMRTMRDVQKARDRIVSSEELDQIKEENNNRFFELTEQLQPFYKFSASGMEYMDAVADAIADGPRGWRESFDADAVPLIQEYVDHLRSLPTEYFEAKANRIMRVNDFAVAVVPRNISPDVKQALQDAGVQLRFYKKGDEADRLRAIQQQDGLLFQTAAPTYYSALTNFVAASQQPKAPASQWKAILSKAPGVKAEEIEWTGVNDWLDAQEGSVTKEDLVAFLEQNGVKIEEVVKSDIAFSDAEKQNAMDELERELLPKIEERARIENELQARPRYDGWRTLGAIADTMKTTIDDPAARKAFEEQPAYIEQMQWTQEREARLKELTEEISRLQVKQSEVNRNAPPRNTQWSSWTLPGGENYREMLLTLPAHTDEASMQAAEKTLNALRAARARGAGLAEINRLTDEWNAARAPANEADAKNFKSSHWSEPNVLAHVRFKERITADGQRTLALEEIQSDWHQTGRRIGYQGDAPDTFIQWYEREGVLFTDNKPFSQLSELEMAGMELRFARSRENERNKTPNAPFKNNAWANLVLKRMIRWAAENGFDSVSWIPGNIQNGQEVDAEDGRSDFYDKIIPNLANKLGKKYGARVERVAVPLDAAPAKTGWEVAGEQPAAAQPARTEQFWSLPITEDLANAALEKGFALFQRGDPKGWGETTPPPDLPPMRLNLAYTRDAYGDDAVKRLPAPIRERAASGSSVDSMMDVARAVKKTLKRKPPKTLTKWINAKRRGYGKSTVSSPTAKGINGIKGAAEELRTMGLEKLINEKSGTDLDYVREAAIEDGFLPEGATVNDLLAAMDAESRGEPTYSRFDEAEVLDLQAAEAWEKMFDDAGINVFEDSDRELRKKLSGFVSSQNDDAVTPDQAAEKFGFGSGEELLNALSNIGNRERHIAEQVRREMQQEFGDPFNDGTLTEKARVLAESEMRARAGEIELEALARAVGEVAASRMAKEMARDTLQMLTVKELSQWRRYLQAERREMQNAMDAVKRGDTVQAFIHKRRQMVNMHLAREGEKLFEQIEKQRKDLQKYETSKNRRDRIAGDYLEKIDDLLSHFELRVSKQGPKEQRRRLSAAEWVAQMDAEGKDNLVSDEARLLAELADRKVWRDMTAEEVDLLASTIQNLAHLGRLKDRLLTEQDQRKFSALVSTLVDRMNETGKLPALLGVKGAEVTRVKSPTKTRTEQVVGALREAHSWLMRPEHQARALDGQELGPLWNALFRPMAEAGNVEIRLMREATEKYRAAWSKFSGIERSRMSSVTIAVPELPAIGKRFTRMDMIAIALNWGVQYNREVLMEPYGWTEAQVEAALARTLDDKHWDLVESIWEIAGMYKEEAFALEKAMTGVEPKSVEGVDFTLPNGRVIKGKYYHIEYDGEQPGEASRKQFNDNVAEELSQHRKSRTKAMTKNGGLIARKGSGGRPVKLSLSVFEKGLAETIHDIAFRRAVYDVSRIVSDRSFADAYQEVAGMENYRQLSVWLKDIAKPPAEALDPITRAFAHVRRNIPLAVMGMKVGTALIQPSGILAAMPLVGHRRLAWAVAKAFANPDKSIFGSWQDVAAKSEFMRDRIAGYERDVRETTKAMTKGGPIDFLRRNAFVFINGMDVAVSTPVWIAAYSKAMDGKVKGIEIGNEEDAIAYADSIVRRTQTAGAMQDLSRFQRGGEFQKQISMIFGYFNNLYAISAQETMDMRRGLMPKGQWAWHMTILFVAIPLLAEFMAGRLIPDDDDDDTLAGKAGEAVLLNFVGMFPGIRDAVTYNLKPEFGYNISPTVKGVQDIAGAAGLPFELLLEEDKELTEADVKRVVRAMGAATGIPSSQINITGDYIYDLLQGDENPAEDPAMAAREALVRDTR